MNSSSAVSAANVDEWRTLVSDAFNPLEVQGVREPFTGFLSSQRLGPASTLSVVAHTQGTMARTNEGISRSDDDSLFLSLSRSEPFTVRQLGRSVSLKKGSACFTVSSLPYDLDCRGPMEQVVVKLPSRALPVSRSDQREVLARAFAQSHPEMALLRAFVEEVLEVADSIDEPSAEVLQQSLFDLCALTIQSVVGEASPNQMERSSLFQAMSAFIRTNAHERSLRAETLAERFHVSRRLVFQLFEEYGSSPARAIRAERLRRAAFLLRTSDASISKIARQSGFTDLSTFARLFHREFGALPSDWRRAR